MKIFNLLGFIAFSFSVSAQSTNPEMVALLEEVITISKDISYYRSSVDWYQLETDMKKIAKGAQEISDLKPALELLLNVLDDHHGQFRSTLDYSIVAHFTGSSNSIHKNHREYDEATWKIINDFDARFDYELFPNHIGYLKIVGVGPNVDGQQEAQRIRNSIAKLHSKKVDKWIVDLRYNGGGNVNVMLSGLAPLFDNRPIVSIQDAKKNTIAYAEVKEENFWYRGSNVFPIETDLQLSSPKIAILTSRWTTSSGEFVAVAFKGQENTRFFGEATEGKTTENSWEVIQDKLALIISTGVYCDRNGVSYKDNVKPDEEIEFKVTNNRKDDLAIMRAVEWLRNG